MNYEFKEIELNSITGQKLEIIKYIPEHIIGILQIVHGMSEHIYRYDEFGKFLARNGFIVIGHTHLGHGKNAKIKGFFGKEDAWNNLINDINMIRNTIQLEYPDVPYNIIGHSMGSFLVRSYLKENYSGINSAIICATGQEAVFKLMAGKLISKIQIALGKGKKPSELLNKMSFSSFNKQFKNVRTDFDWICRDKNEVDKYINDPYCGFPFTAWGYNAIFNALLDLEHTNYDKVDKDISILFIAGSEDPVGNNSKSVKALYNKFKYLHFKNVNINIYEKGRHEILNEINKKEVYNDVLAFLESSIK